MSLKPTPPHDAKNRYLNDKKSGVIKKTLKNYRTTTRQFCDWLDEQDITDLNDLDSEVIQRYKDVTDEHGWEPLLTSKSGRVVETTIQRYVYTATRPCYYNCGECPFYIVPETR
jgi:site-specific recombinase XerD